MSEQILPNPHATFKYVVLGILVAMFLIALPMMFVHPGVALLLVWLGLITLAVVGIVRLFWRYAAHHDVD